jgi:hypothetical protein
MEQAQVSILGSTNSTFPWTKFYRLLGLPEIVDPQLEDGVNWNTPSPTELAEFFENDSRRVVWLASYGERAIGFVSFTQESRLRWEIHTGFRPGVPGAIKKKIGIGVLALMNHHHGMQCVYAYLPECNRGGLRMAAECGLSRWGIIPHSFLRDGIRYHTILVGATW